MIRKKGNISMLKVKERVLVQYFLKVISILLLHLKII